MIGSRVRGSLAGVAQRVLGPGWMYRMPKRYDGVIGPRFGAVRDQAYCDLLAALDRDGRRPATVVDLACGSGLSTVWLAEHLPGTRLVGLDQSRPMLAEARRRAASVGVDDRCRFVRADARTVDLGSLGLDRPADLVIASLGFSVMPDWEVVFEKSLRLLGGDGTYVVFDQYVDGLYLASFDADQSRASWRLVESAFETSETRWYGNCFLSIGTGHRS